jgi:cardiolipin synthase
MSCDSKTSEAAGVKKVEPALVRGRVAAVTPSSEKPLRLLAEQALSRVAGAPLIGGNSLELLIDAEAHFEAWLKAIRGAQQRVLMENYIFCDDDIGRLFRDTLTERASAGVTILVVADWLGCLGQSRRSFWEPLRAAGGQVRVFNPPRIGEPFGWIRRDHRKLLVVDGTYGSLSGVCVSAKWLGRPERSIPPWRDTGVELRGPAVAELEDAFLQSWKAAGPAIASFSRTSGQPVGSVALRVIATQPASGSVYRLDQQVAAMARSTLWLSDAYFVGVTPYVQALVAAAQDGVDVRLLVPGTSDIPAVARMSRSGYRPLLRAGIRVFEWNGSMLHAKTAVADGQWARVGSSNLNVSSWLGNFEVDIAVENAGFAGLLAAQYEVDLQNATEIVLAPRRFRRGEQIQSDNPRPPRTARGGGSSGRAAAGALRIANTVRAALGNRRVLGEAAGVPWLTTAIVFALLAVVAVLWPAAIGWPFAAFAAWLALNLGIRGWRQRARNRREGKRDEQ